MLHNIMNDRDKKLHSYFCEVYGSTTYSDCLELSWFLCEGGKSS